jgi:hypothetical protein
LAIGLALRQVPSPESWNAFPVSGTNSHLYFPGDRVNLSTPNVSSLRQAADQPETHDSHNLRPVEVQLLRMAYPRRIASSVEWKLSPFSPQNRPSNTKFWKSD